LNVQGYECLLNTTIDELLKSHEGPESTATGGVGLGTPPF
jgi:hypothetical protein